jgi:multisubunit Na+/H+ antiporter MnhB subunit
MKDKLILIWKIVTRIIVAIVTLGGIIQFIQLLRTPDIDLKSVLLSFPAWVIYVFILIAIILILLRNKDKSTSQEIERLRNALNEEIARVASLTEIHNIPPFKKKFYLTTERLYNNLAEHIQNNVVINTIEISNTIEKKGSGNKRNSNVKLLIQGTLTKKMSNFHILVAGDTIVGFDDIKIKAVENRGGKQFNLPVRIADKGQDSLLKLVVISYDKVKQVGDNFDLIINWCWPNMLDIEDRDYITLPNYLSQNVKHMRMSLTNKENMHFKSASIYKYGIGMSSPELIKDIDVSDGSNIIFYEENDPLTNACYILYYEVK